MPKPAGYYNGILNGSAEGVLTLARKYSIHPPDDAEGDIGTETRKIVGARDSGDLTLRQMKTGRQVAWMDFQKSPKGQKGVTLGNEGGRTLFASATYTRDDTKTAAYWLPWTSLGGIIQTKLPTAGTPGQDPDPNLFFTAAINGCSVFFEGPASSPTVFHAGGTTDQSTKSGGAKFWRDIITRMRGGGHLQEVNKTDYVTQDGVKRGTTSTTKDAKDYETWLASNKSDTLEIKDIGPWGCVFGFRKGGNWEFWLQQNVSISYTKMKKKFGVFGGKLVAEQEKKMKRNKDGTVEEDKNKGKSVYIDSVRTVSNPISLTKVFPGVGRIFIPVRQTLPNTHG